MSRRSAHGANNVTHTPKIYETDGGGGGGSSYGGGCIPGTYFTLAGYLISCLLVLAFWLFDESNATIPVPFFYAGNNGLVSVATRSGGIMQVSLTR